MVLRIEFQDGECFWGGCSSNGTKNPYTKDSEYSADYRISTSNQTAPLFLSNFGRYVWSEKPFKVDIANGVMTLEGEDIISVNAGTCLKDAYLAAMNAHFPFDGKRLPDVFFKTAQYNTWMEFTYFPTQEGVLEYARNIVKHGFVPGILIIDEGWHGRYGDWRFDEQRFPDPKKMVDELHKLGFKVMLWVVPLVCPDGLFFMEHTFKYFPTSHKDAANLLLRNAENDVALVRWWNGFSAIVDLRKECDRNFLDAQLQALMDDYGIDGFKVDGGNLSMYHSSNRVNGTPRPDHDAHELNEAWNEFGRKYEFHEFKDTYKGGGKNCIQRLCDKSHSWHKNGINELVPCSIVQGLIGTPFICPDMIGGGSWVDAHKRTEPVDEELFVRMAQVSAFCPMMQFSWAPWRVLGEKALNLLKEASQLHLSLSDELMELIRDAEVNGEPILRNLEYNCPHHGYELIQDEFMLGENILVAPVVTPNTYEREVSFPDGVWQDSDGNVYEGLRSYSLKAPIEKILYFRRVSK